MHSAGRRQASRSSDRLRRLRTWVFHTDESRPLIMARKNSGVHEAFFFSFAFDVASTMGWGGGGAQHQRMQFCDLGRSRPKSPYIPRLLPDATHFRMAGLLHVPTAEKYQQLISIVALSLPHSCTSVFLAYPNYSSRSRGSAWGHAADLAPSSIGLLAAICLAFEVFFFSAAALQSMSFFPCMT